MEGLKLTPQKPCPLKEMYRKTGGDGSNNFDYINASGKDKKSEEVQC